MAAAEGMATPPLPPAPTITDLPLLPLACIASRLDVRDVRAMCGTCRMLRGAQPDLLRRARPSLLARRIFEPLHSTTWSRIALSRDGTRVATVHQYSLFTGAFERTDVADVSVGPVDGELRPVASSGRLYVSAIAFYGEPDARLVQLHGFERATVLAPDGRIIVGVKERPVYTRHPIYLSGDAAVHLRLEDDRRLIYEGAGHRVDLDLPPGTDAWIILSARVNVALRRATICDTHGFVHVYDLGSGTCLHTLAANPDRHPIRVAEFSGDGAFLVTLDMHGNLRVWNTTSWTLHCSGPPQHTRSSAEIAVRGNTILITAADRDIVMLDIVSRTSICVTDRTQDSPRAVALSPDRTRAVVAHKDGCVETWHLGSLAARLERRGRRRAAAASAAE